VLRLGVAEDNEQAATLYRRNGFTGTGELTGPPPDGIRMEKVMVKQFQPPAGGG
jgi:ribosomal protein S18 acetylase RimI-like enzyme